MADVSNIKLFCSKCDKGVLIFTCEANREGRTMLYHLSGTATCDVCGRTEVVASTIVARVKKEGDVPA